MKKILCSNTDLPRVFAHVLDDGTIDIVRQDQRFTIIGETFTLIGTNPQGEGKTVLTVKDGKLVEDDIKFKEDNPNGEESNNGQGGQPEGNRGGRAEPTGSGGEQASPANPTASSNPPAPEPARNSGEPAQGLPSNGQANGKADEGGTGGSQEGEPQSEPQGSPEGTRGSEPPRKYTNK